MKKVKEVVIISGKGGTGKTTLTASLAEIIPQKVIVDADVDAANLHILLKPQNVNETEFQGMSLAEINGTRCNSCGLCKDLCRFHAIERQDGAFIVNPFGCEGCGLCAHACPVDAVGMNPQIVGKWFTADTDHGPFVYARLIPGAENSGGLVSIVKRQAKTLAMKKNIPLLLMDGPPGIGCPVISAVTGVDLGIIVIEPTLSGISDLERIHGLLLHFKVKCGIVINRYDINTANTRRIEDFAREKGIPVYTKIPHLQCIMNEITQARIPSGNCPELAAPVRDLYNIIESEVI